MLKICTKLNQLSFSGLMDVYEEGNLENARDLWPDLPEGQQLAMAEQEFYSYLWQVFFPVEGAVYALWEVSGKYVSALRLEPYEDGLLLEALETAPGERRKGYARDLILAVQEEYPGRKIYSHVGKRNVPSLAVHKGCGFCKILDHAVYIDGSVNDRCCTLLYWKKKPPYQA